MKVTKEGFEFEVKDQDFWNDSKWESFTYKSVSLFSNNKKIFLDIGAWIGPISLVASKLNKTVHAIEPDNVAFSQLEENLKLNNIENVILHNMAISNKTKMLTLGNDTSLGNSNTRINSSTNSFQVQGKSLNEFIEENNINKEDISMIKIDVEGAELDIIKDKFFDDMNNIPIHLSIHSPFFLNPEKDMSDIYKFTSRYLHLVSEYDDITRNRNIIERFLGFYSVMLFN